MTAEQVARRMPTPGLVIAAPASGSGKTTITLGLLRALRDAGVRTGSAKVGPDYIDPKFHAAASGSPCVNLDGWAMRPELLDGLASRAAMDVDLLIAEGVMGLFDGAAVAGATNNGSTADLAERLDWPVILVIDARAQAQSVAALAAGFRDHRPELAFAGVILNRVGGVRHARLLTGALESVGITVFGAVPRDSGLEIPSRHLGLVQAGEHADLENFINHAARTVAGHVDLKTFKNAARVGRATAPIDAPTDVLSGATLALPPLGQRIAVARDQAFGFAYPHLLDGWRAAGADLIFFSPLANEAPTEAADSVFLPGGYPELHAAALAANEVFLEGLRDAAGKGLPIYGECGGYMVLGESLTDTDGHSHRMAGLLGVETSFAKRSLSLGYRLQRALLTTPLGPAGRVSRGHEFHYATVSREGGDRRLFAVEDAEGTGLGNLGLARGSVIGSFMHLIDRAP
jgi:cobyrinic acid a,c-diamide synthase